ncbi:hypothetical protein Tco_0873679 [Tanacetum coccineum]|uniref:Transposase (Putative), gypsy type n=1 Tax=Tanacetum coccineum TaxID=301880 RepID=A0ABQ5BN27_9ASTR
MGKDTIQLENAVSTISQEYLLKFTSECGIPEGLHPELPGPEDTIVDFSKGKVVIGAAKRVFPTVVDWCASTPKDGMPTAGSYSAEDVTVLDTHQMDLFNLISAPNPTKVKTRTRPRAAHEVPLLTVTASRVIDMEDPTAATESSGTPSTIKKRRKRASDEADANAPPKVLRKDHAAARPEQSTHGGKSLASIGLEAGTTCVTPATQEALSGAKSVSDPDPLSYARPQPHPERDMAQSSKETAPEISSEHVATTEAQGQTLVESPESGKSASFLSMDGSPGDIYQPKWGVTNNCRLDTPDVCQDTVDHIVPPGYFFELRHLLNTDFHSQYNVNLTRQVAMGSQLRLRFEQEARLLKKATTKIAKRDQRIQAREEYIKKLEHETSSLKTVDTEVQGLRNQAMNLETLLEAELSQQVSTLQAQVTGEERIKAAFEEFKKYEDERVNSRCAEMDARLDKLSVDFDEELYPHMLTAIAGRRWVIGHGLRLAVMKCAESSEIRRAFADVVSAGLAKGMSEGLKYGVEHGKAGRDLADIEA